jgi:CheY-like chemotaxis protein
MNGIIGTAELLKDLIFDDEQKDLLSIIDVSANNLLSIINDILDISKLEAGKVDLEIAAFDIYDLVAEVIKMLSVRVVKNEVQLIADIDPEVPKMLYGDALRLKQIIINFVNNAIKFTKKGSVTIAIKILKNQTDKIKLKIEVIDTGIGISEIGLTKLFKEFSQVDQSMYKKFGGTGLGLMISKKLSELMGGDIGVESNIDKGSIFWIDISFQKGIKKTNLNMDDEMDDLSSSSRQLKILVAEDNMINQKVAMINLRQLGHSVEIASNGQLAFDMFKSGEYDIILMDIQMPVLDGIEATVAIRKHEEENNLDKIRIVAITANAQKEDRDRCFEVGMDNFITKPFRPDDLIRILNF